MNVNKEIIEQIERNNPGGILCLALPELGNPTRAHCNTVLRAAIGSKFHIDQETVQSSLLAHGFNEVWCRFLNEPRCKLFGMLHADVSADQLHIFDIMHDEMMANGYDIIHAPCRIKDQYDLTSTAIGNKDEPFGAIRRLTMTELLELPETFSFRDMLPKYWHSQGYFNCMLINTGCMLVKRGPWCDSKDGMAFPGFNITSRIAWNPHTEKWIPLCEPEDWNLSRYCAKHHLVVGATRKVVTRHFGGKDFRNDLSDGQWKTDMVWADAEEMRLKNLGRTG